MTDVGLLILPLIIGLTIFLCIPSLIVIFWQKRPVLAFVVGCLVLFVSLAVPALIYMMPNIAVTSDTDLASKLGYYFGFVLGIIFVLIIPALFLAGVQWIARRRYKKKQLMNTETPEDVFS
jgi:MFS-type transporter involved in bile tolerance (Atg22 family)